MNSTSLDYRAGYRPINPHLCRGARDPGGYKGGPAPPSPKKKRKEKSKKETKREEQRETKIRREIERNREKHF